MYIPSQTILGFLERFFKPKNPGRRSGAALPEPAALVGVEAKRSFFLKKQTSGLTPQEVNISHLGKFGKSSTQLCRKSGGYVNPLGGNLEIVH